MYCSPGSAAAHGAGGSPGAVVMDPFDPALQASLLAGLNPPLCQARTWLCWAQVCIRACNSLVHDRHSGAACWRASICRSAWCAPGSVGNDCVSALATLWSITTAAGSLLAGLIPPLCQARTWLSWARLCIRACTSCGQPDRAEACMLSVEDILHVPLCTISGLCVVCEVCHPTLMHKQVNITSPWVGYRHGAAPLACPRINA